MKTIQLTKGFVALVDDADYDRVSAHKWYANPNRWNVYAARHTNGRTVFMHRFLLGVTDRKVKVDHVNHNGLDNQRHNLRTCSDGQNQMNQKKRTGMSSTYKGVCLHKGRRKFQAGIKINGKSKFLGYYRDELQAALAYDVAAREHFGEFALSNFPPKKPCTGRVLALDFAHGGISA